MPFWFDNNLLATRGWVRRQLQETVNMLDITKLKSTVDAVVAQEATFEGAVKGDITTIVTSLNDLSAKVGSGETITQSDIDAVTAEAAGLQSKLADLQATVDAAAATAKAADPGPVTPPAPPAA